MKLTKEARAKLSLAAFGVVQASNVILAFAILASILLPVWGQSQRTTTEEIHELRIGQLEERAKNFEALAIDRRLAVIDNTLQEMRLKMNELPPRPSEVPLNLTAAGVVGLILNVVYREIMSRKGKPE